MNFRDKVYAGASRAAARQSISEESYFIDPIRNIKIEVKLADFKHDETGRRGEETNIAKVYEAKYDDHPYAIKKIHRIEMKSDDVPDPAFDREMSFLREATGWQCPNIVEFYGYIRYNKSSVCLILQLMDRDLREVIIHSPDFYDGSGINVMDPLFPNDVIEKLGYMMLKDIANGLRFVHGCNPDRKVYMHRDIKPTNIMIDMTNHRLRIIDFGTTKGICGNMLKIQSCEPGCQRYQAPECLEMDPKYDKSCDIWSLGITMIYFLTGRHPIWDDNAQSKGSSEIIYQRICGRNFDDEKVDWHVHLSSKQLSQEFKDLINKCVDREPSNRPSAEDLYNKAKKKVDQMDQELTYKMFHTFFGSHGT